MYGVCDVCGVCAEFCVRVACVWVWCVCGMCVVGIVFVGCDVCVCVCVCVVRVCFMLFCVG